MSPRRFARSSLPQHFGVNSQEDSCEYLRHILNAVNDEASDQDSSSGTPVEQNFQTTLTRTFGCLQCGDETVLTDVCLDLPLTFPEEHCYQYYPDITLDVLAMLCSHFEPKYMMGENAMTCDSCQSEGGSKIGVYVTEAPRYLILTLSRFHYEWSSRSKLKISTKTNYPLSLQLPVTTRKDDDANDVTPTLNTAYSLTSVIFHSGNAYCGHYFACARHSDMAESNDSDSSHWFLLNDSHTSVITYEDICNVKATAHALVYVKTQVQIKPNRLHSDVEAPSTRRKLRSTPRKQRETYGRVSCL